MINLNKRPLTKEGVLNYIDDIDIYTLYTGKEVHLKKVILSPFDSERRPSFGYFLGDDGGICFNDFRFGGGDCIKFVQILFNLTFMEALNKIAVDFKLTYFFHDIIYIKQTEKINNIVQQNREEVIKRGKSTLLQVRKREWKQYDLDYWSSYGVSEEVLHKYNVFPIDYIFFNGNPRLADKYAYVFYEFKDSETTLKIYQPFSEYFKWLNNHNSTIWQGWVNLPTSGKDLIITKSLKDVMAITSQLQIPSVALQSESSEPKNKIITELKSRFTNLYLLYDNDYDKKINSGRIMGGKIAKQYAITQIEIPTEFKSKDFSDLIKNYGNKHAKKICKRIIKEKK